MCIMNNVCHIICSSKDKDNDNGEYKTTHLTYDWTTKKTEILSQGQSHQDVSVIIPDHKRNVLMCFSEKNIRLYYPHLRQWFHSMLPIMPKIYAAAMSPYSDYVVVVRERERTTRNPHSVIDIIRACDNNGRYEMVKQGINLKVSGLVDIVITKGSRNDRLQMELLTVGFVKKQFKLKSYSDLSLPPICLIKIIERWVQQEFIHVIQRNITKFGKRKHFRMALDDLIN